MELDYKAIGKRIKIARIKADLTQERLAELIDISPTHLSNIETGTTRVSLNTIISIANALSVTGDDLLCDNIIMSKVQFEKDIALLLEDCDEYEIRIIKDMRNSANRQSNCDSANINKMVRTAARQVDDIRYIEEHFGFEQLPPQLREMAQVRLENPDVSLQELGTYLDPPVGKSGVNHRLRKLKEIAESLRAGKEK